MRLRQHLLQHEDVHVGPAVSKEMQGEHADIVVFTGIAGDVAAAGKE